ncbi:uncharacterized protein [Bemisia tabaci]|uniref:uncharacterized protein isoform X1 n=2 Tax=Bemisia tabaci TaxID=7038 RepID=UPI003B284681
MFWGTKFYVVVSKVLIIDLIKALADTPDSTSSILEETPQDKKEILEKHKIVPKVLAYMPKYVLSGSFDGKEMSFGNSFTPDEIRKPPIFLDWPINGTKALYCLLAIGIDVPNEKKPKLRDFRHWFVGNIPGTDIAKGRTYLPYIGAGDFLDQGSHRIVFVVFQQPGSRRIKFYEKKLTKMVPINRARGNSSTLKFAEKYSLREPVAANFLTVETDVPQSTTDYYAHTTIEVPPDWEGISMNPQMVGLTIPSIPSDEEFEKELKLSRSERRRGKKSKKKVEEEKSGPYADYYEDDDDDDDDEGDEDQVKNEDDESDKEKDNKKSEHENKTEDKKGKENKDEKENENIDKKKKENEAEKKKENENKDKKKKENEDEKKKENEDKRQEENEDKKEKKNKGKKKQEKRKKKKNENKDEI